jgi:type I restriction enzyme S subunit
MTEQTNLQLPKGWKYDKLGKVCKTTSGGTPSRKNKSFYEGDIPWIKSGELNSIQILDSEEKISKEAIENSSAKIFPKGTLLIALYGATIGKLGILGIDAATNQAICGIYKNEKIETKFLYWYLFSKRPYLIEQGIGGAQPNISQTILKELEIPLSPLPEQHRIVAKIEELFSELDKAAENLQTARQQLKIYRQSVLKHAFEGKLTAAWRESLKFKNESLKLAAEPESIYQTQNGLPEGWEWKEFGTFISRITAGKSVKCIERPPVEDELGIVKVSAVSWGNFKEEESKTTDYSKYNENYIIKKDDFLFSRANTIELVGACVLVNNINLKLMLSDKILRFDFRDISKKYALYYLRSPIGRKNIEELATGNQDSMRNISQANINRIIIPFCPIDKQHQIVAEIEKRFSEADKLEESIETALRQTEALRQSILKKAFAGKLVANDENKAGE